MSGDSSRASEPSALDRRTVCGGFDCVSDTYSKSRRGIPDEILQEIDSHIGAGRKRILDLGCGTGISSRQIAREDRKIVGLDSSRNMIFEALDQKSRNVSYAVGGAEDIPFTSNFFHAVTCFSSFHWFCNKEAETEIRRVLKPGGVLVVVNKYERTDLRRKVRRILSNVKGTELRSPKSGYEPLWFLRKCGWPNVQITKLSYLENYNYDSLLAYVRSFDSWGRLSDLEQEICAPNIQTLCQELTQGAAFEVLVDVEIVVSIKPEIH